MAAHGLLVPADKHSVAVSVRIRPSFGTAAREAAAAFNFPAHVLEGSDQAGAAEALLGGLVDKFVHGGTSCTLMAYGRDGYVEMLKRQIGLARRVTQWLMRDGRFEVLPRGGGGQKEMLAKTYIVVLFRLRNDEKNRDFVRKVNATGRIYMSGTVWEGKPAGRIAVSNWQADVERDGYLIESVLDEVAGH